jgi:hypothetical protein
MVPFSPVYLVPLGFVVFGSPFMTIGFISKRKNTTIGGWPRVKGRIVSSAVRSSEFQELNTFDRKWAPSSPNNQGEMVNRTSYSAEARFSYEAGGKTREGQTISREGIMGANAQGWVDRHPPGTEVDVYVDPSDPARAYLEWKRWTMGTIFMFAFGGVFWFIAVLLLVIFMLVG